MAPIASSQNTRPRVLVTRPTHQAEPFCQLLTAAGFEPVRCPTVEICAADDTALAKDQLEHVKRAELVIFTSANAVRYADQLVPLQHALKTHSNILAIGPATAAALAHCGLRPQWPKSDFSSEGLLAMPALQNIAGKTAVLVRGVGGLTTLPESLLKARAQLRLAEVYKRVIPKNVSLSKQLFHTELPQIISTTSNESLSNLVTLIPVEEHPRLWRLPVIVNSERGEYLAQSLGFCDEILRASPVGDHGQISTLKAWITQRLTQR